MIDIAAQLSPKMTSLRAYKPASSQAQHITKLQHNHVYWVDRETESVVQHSSTTSLPYSIFKVYIAFYIYYKNEATLRVVG